ncbi:MAG: hypothetical protein ACRYG7_43795 [Janthinobacterium lividum]
MSHTVDAQTSRMSEVTGQHRVQQRRNEVKDISLLLDWAPK